MSAIKRPITKSLQDMPPPGGYHGVSIIKPDLF